MSTPQCPTGYTFVSKACYGACPSGTAASASYPEKCVSSTSCQLGTTADVTGLSCVKNVTDNGIVDKPTDGCAAGYTEWLAGKCYVNCSGFFIEGGVDCKKKWVPRDTEEPVCNNFFQVYSGLTGKCEGDSFKMLVTGSIFFFVLVGIVTYNLRNGRCRRL